MATDRSQPWPGRRHMNMESIYEYGSRAGFWRIWRLFTRKNVPLTVYGVATALARNGELSLSRAVELMTSGPARAFKLPFGTLAPGALADVIVVDPKKG